MPDLLSWSLPITHWARTPVRVHMVFVLFAATRLVAALFHPAGAILGAVETVAWLILLVLALLLHELAEWWVARRLGLVPVDVCLWPLGNFVLPSGQVSTRSPDRAAAAAAGLGTSLCFALAGGLALSLLGVRPLWDPFGEPGKAVLSFNPFRFQPRLAPLAPVWWLAWFAFLNWVIFLANLIPALPFDLGRISRGWLGGFYRDREISPYLARVFAVVLGLVGIFRISFNKPGGLLLLLLAALIEWLVRHEARMLEENGYFEEGAFGYDFSQGYTSLEAGPSKVRPRKEGALRRWRRRQSEQRKLRRERKSAAESLRLDEILQKLHVSGRSALTSEEQRFLIRVSRKLRHRKS
jgi:Zn-dependent protease